MIVGDVHGCSNELKDLLEVWLSEAEGRIYTVCSKLQ